MSDAENKIPLDIRQTIALGMDAERLLQSSVGRYLIFRCEQKVLAALEQMKTVDPFDSKAVRALQNEVQVGESIQYWIADVITEGDNAAKAFESQQDF